MLKTKILILLLAVVILLAGCGGNSQPEPTWGTTLETAAPEPVATVGKVHDNMPIMLYQEKLQNGVIFEVYEDGRLLLYGGDLTQCIVDTQAFKSYQNEITILEIGDGVRVIGEKVFAKADKIQKILIGDSVEKIEYYAFSNCSELTQITFGSALTEIADYAFSDCTKLTDVNLSGNITTIGEYVFSGCTSLKSAILGSSIQKIGNCIFAECTGLTSLRTTPSSPVWSWRILWSIWKTMHSAAAPTCRTSPSPKT